MSQNQSVKVGNVSLSNPRIVAEFDNWPSGSKRVKCTFQVHRSSKGWRASRTTTGKPQFTTYSGATCIVDGDDGKTYILRVAAVVKKGQVVNDYGFIDVHRFDLLSASKELGRESAVSRELEENLYGQLLMLIVNSGTLNMVEE